MILFIGLITTAAMSSKKCILILRSAYTRTSGDSYDDGARPSAATHHNNNSRSELVAQKAPGFRLQALVFFKKAISVFEQMNRFMLLKQYSS